MNTQQQTARKKHIRGATQRGRVPHLNRTVRRPGQCGGRVHVGADGGESGRTRASYELAEENNPRPSYRPTAESKGKHIQIAWIYSTEPD